MIKMIVVIDAGNIKEHSIWEKNEINNNVCETNLFFFLLYYYRIR